MIAKLNNSILKNVYNLSTDSQCLFVQKWSEMFFYKTINTYQFRLRNAHTILIETKQVLQLIREEQNISASNLKDLTLESKKLLEKDLCFRKHYKDLLPTLLKGLKINSTDKNDLLQLEYRLNNALRFISNTYLQNLIKDLEIAIISNDFYQVEHYSEILASELIHLGWSPRSLSRLIKLYFLSNTYKYLTFEEKWEKFISSTTSNTGIFHCYFKLSRNQSDYLSKLKASDLRVVNGEEILRTFVSINSHIQEDAFYIVENTEAYYEDIHSAVEKCRYQLAIRQSVLSYFNIELENFDNALVVFPNEDKIVDYTLEQGTDLEVETDNDDIQSIINLLNQDKILPRDNRRLINFFRQYDLSIKAISLETIYSNLWSSVESLLVTGHHGSNIEHIKKIIPSIMCSRYVQNLFKNFLYDCYRAGVKPIIKGKQIKTEDFNSLNDVFEMLTDESESINFLSSLNDYTLLKQRAAELSNELMNSETLKDLMTNHYNTVTWQIQRLYRVRNNLVHSAKAERDINLLIEHLHFYIRSTINELIFRLNNNDFNSLGDLYLAIEDNYYTLIEVLKNNISNSKKGSIQKFDSELIFTGAIFGYK
ncbi:hypothetical protein ACFFIX_20260 [Metabacillus herbersteinensis]|uniref:Apea-like HEPN domain-containing protein n=1 Tax=Metabacillus herbersteinensis TaxID=283816 RepID=A0ABV6GJ50_9BACI